MSHKPGMQFFSVIKAIRHFLCHHLVIHTHHSQIVPTIKAKWPANASKKIYIQQDNAKPHLRAADQQFEEITSTDGFEFHLISQPANSQTQIY